MSVDLDWTLLPDLPQRGRLAEVVADLAADPNVVAIWLTGSLARGAGDPYSDVDLGIALRTEAYAADEMPAAQASQRMTFDV
jgi:predicted nucleotidyltransferase